MTLELESAGQLDARDRGGPEQPLLTVENFKKHFPIHAGLFNRQVAAVKAVDDVSFYVRKGETLGVVGESGCGKSTLARLLMHLLPHDEGRLVLDGDELGSGASLADLRHSMQMVFQDSSSSLNPRLPIGESIAFGPRVRGASGSEAKAVAYDLLERVGLRPERFANRYPHELSGGQKQRVNIARALALKPRLLILDEAVSALDKSVEAQVLNLLAELKAQFNLTYIFISHDLHVVRYISDRVLVMYLGQIVEIGPVDAIYQQPRHPYTMALLERLVPSQPWYGNPTKYEYDPDKAKELLKEAGCVPCKITVAISTSGSGQMQPLPMNELVKEQLEDVGFQVELKPMDWNALIGVFLEGAKKSGEMAMNFSLAPIDPVQGVLKTNMTRYISPNGTNWGAYSNPDVDKWGEEALAEFDTDKRNALLTKMNEQSTKDATEIFIVHDLNPRALSPKLHGFVQAQNWFQDLTPITVDP